MDKIDSIASITDCYGCGLCATICPKGIIDIDLNADGFYEPQILSIDKCLNCGLCLKICSYAQDSISTDRQVLASFAAWSKDSAVRRKTSSGGVGFEIARFLIEKQKYKACVVRYNSESNRAEHYIATTLDELIPSMGSKYIQSYTLNGFKEINLQDKYLVVGTPCQVDSFRRYIKLKKIENNFILMDFFCHGVPSKWVWDKYLAEVENQTGKVVYASWRNKSNGWHDSWAVGMVGAEKCEKIDWHDSYNLLIRGKKNFYTSRYSQGDAFYNLFLSDNCLGKACYDHCKYKYHNSAADIRIGDLWGQKYRQNDEGVSGVAVYSTKGKDVLKQSYCTLVEEPFEVVAEGQMKTPPQRGKLYPILHKMLRDKNTSIQELNLLVVKEKRKHRNIKRLKHPLRTLKNIVKKIFKR